MDYVVGNVAALISGNVTPNRPKTSKKLTTPTKRLPSPNVTPKSEFTDGRAAFLSPTMQRRKAVLKKSPKRIFQNNNLDESNEIETNNKHIDKAKKHLNDDLGVTVHKRETDRKHKREQQNTPEEVNDMPSKKKKKLKLKSGLKETDDSNEARNDKTSIINSSNKDHLLKRVENSPSVSLAIDESRNEIPIKKTKKRKNKNINGALCLDSGIDNPTKNDQISPKELKKSKNKVKSHNKDSVDSTLALNNLNSNDEEATQKKKKKKKKNNKLKNKLENDHDTVSNGPSKKFKNKQNSNNTNATEENSNTINNESKQNVNTLKIHVNPNAITDKDSDSEHESDNQIDSENETNENQELENPLADESTDDEITVKTKTVKKDKEADKEYKPDNEELKRTLFVGNVPFSKKCKKEIKKIFNKHGNIESVRIRTIPIKDERSTPKLALIKNELHPDRSTVNVYIKFAHASSVDKALVENNTVLKDHHLRVSRSTSTGADHDVNRSVFVGNIPFAMEDEALRSIFDKCGEIESVRIIRDKKTNIGKGFGYVNFKSKDGVELALSLSEADLTVKNRIMRVKRCSQGDQKRKQGNRHVKPNSRGTPKNGQEKIGAYRRIMNKRKPTDSQYNDGPPNKKNKNFNSQRTEKKSENTFVGMTAEKKKKKKFDKGGKKKKAISEILAKGKSG